MKQILDKYRISIKLLLVLTVGIIILTALFYFLIPNILNYPKGTYNSDFQFELEGTNYNVQALLMVLSIFVFFVIIVFIKTHFLVKYRKMFDHPDEFSDEDINYVRNKLYNSPYSMYVLNIIVPSILITCIHAWTINQLGITTLKIFILIFSFVTVYVSVFLIYTKRLFKTLLLKLPPLDEVCYKKVSMKYYFFYHILPLMVVAILFTALIGYSKIIDENGNSIFAIYKEKLTSFVNANEPQSLSELIDTFSSVSLYGDNDILFIQKPNGTYISIDGEEITFSAYFDKYLNELSSQKDGRVYEYYGVDAQGCVCEININNETYLIGVYYEITSYELLYYFFLTFIILLILNSVVLYLFALSYSNDIQTVINSFSDIINDHNKTVTNKIGITSNDEIGDLCVAFNNIQDLTTEYVNQIHANQDMLIERERFASLRSNDWWYCT